MSRKSAKHQPVKSKKTIESAKSWRQILGITPPRYVLVDATTGEDLREIRDSEVEYIRRNASFSGVASIDGRAVSYRRVEGAGRTVMSGGTSGMVAGVVHGDVCGERAP